MFLATWFKECGGPLRALCGGPCGLGEVIHDHRGLRGDGSDASGKFYELAPRSACRVSSDRVILAKFGCVGTEERDIDRSVGTEVASSGSMTVAIGLTSQPT